MSEAKEMIKKMVEIQNQSEEIKKEMAGWSGIVQYDFEGDVFHVVYNSDGTCEFKEGAADSPTFTIKASADYWLQVLQGKEDPVSGFMMGKYKIEGNIMEAQRLGGVLKKFQGKL